MIAKIKNILQKTIEKILGKKIIFIDKKDNKKLAVKSSLGFWYTGDIFNKQDISYGILKNGIVEKEETYLVKKILDYFKDGITFFDIGANTGYYGIMSAYLNNKNIVHSFEPLTEHTEILEESIKINNLENRLSVHRIALGSEDKEENIFLAGTGTTLIKDFSKNSISGKRKIFVKNGDKYIKNNQISNPDFIKIDVEGYETEVIKGLKNTISNSKPVLFIEIAYSLKNISRDYENQNFEEIFNILNELGYKPYKLIKDSIEIFDYKNERPDGINMYLFLNKNHSDIKDILEK